MKKFRSLITATILTVIVFLIPVIMKLIEPVNAIIVFIIGLLLILIAFFLGCFSKSVFKFLYTVVAELIFVLSGLILYRDFCNWGVIRDYGLVILISTVVAIFVGSVIRQIIVAIVKAICKKVKTK
ncbi:MAG: hypothetical protein IKV25_02565 [Clostridia bacterium]|nr:hypothetical protein [Clostridia bacterium]